MTKSVRTVLLAAAALLIVAGIGAMVFALTFDFDADTDKIPDETLETTRPEVIHEDVEYIYDAEGNLKSEVFYKDNVYNGQRDYYRDGKDEYITEFDKDHNEIMSSVTNRDALGNISTVTTYKDGKIYETVEYNYYDDFVTPSKKTVKTYEGDCELAEKTYFSEKGVKTRTCYYEDGDLLKEVFYDENGKPVDKGGETVEE